MIGGFIMREFWNTIQLVFTAVGGWLGWFLGGSDGLLFALGNCMDDSYYLPKYAERCLSLLWSATDIFLILGLLAQALYCALQ